MVFLNMEGMSLVSDAAVEAIGTEVGSAWLSSGRRCGWSSTR
jgi:hypothetical protein